MKFQNRPNECVYLSDGREAWLSRSVVVAVTAVVLCGAEPYVLINRRGPGLPNYVGYWNLPCGYLDYDETTSEAAVREVWEECGVDVRPLWQSAIVEYMNSVWGLDSTPKGAKQNVSLHYGLLTEVDTLPQVCTLNAEQNEVSEVCWWPLRKVDELEYAFGHDQKINLFLQRIYEDLGAKTPQCLLPYVLNGC